MENRGCLEDVEGGSHEPEKGWPYERWHSLQANIDCVIEVLIDFSLLGPIIDRFHEPP